MFLMRVQSMAAFWRQLADSSSGYFSEAEGSPHLIL